MLPWNMESSSVRLLVMGQYPDKREHHINMMFSFMNDLSFTRENKINIKWICFQLKSIMRY